MTLVTKRTPAAQAVLPIKIPPPQLRLPCERGDDHLWLKPPESAALLAKLKPAFSVTFCVHCGRSKP